MKPESRDGMNEVWVVEVLANYGWTVREAFGTEAEANSRMYDLEREYPDSWYRVRRFVAAPKETTE